MLFDTHAHYDDKQFDCDRESLIASLPQNNISLVMNVGADVSDSIFSKDLALKYDFFYASAGVHPHYVNTMTSADLDTLKSLFDCKKVKAIGEIGLDYHYDDHDKAKQKQWFDHQLSLAESLDVPVIIHDRDAHSDCIDIIKAHHVKAVFHCFSGSLQMAKQLINMGIYLSFTGVVTFKNARKIPEIISYIPNERLMIETDCPYLSPEPYRGQRNSSLYLSKTAQAIARMKGWTFEQCCEITKQNGLNFFNI